MLKVAKLLPDARERLKTITTDSSLIEAAALLNSPQIDLVVVCDTANRIAGVITKSDVVGRISQCTGSSCTMPAALVMSENVTSCRLGDRLEGVWAIIKENGWKNVPILDQHSVPVGVLNAREVVQALLADVKYEEKLLYDYVMGFGYR